MEANQKDDDTANGSRWWRLFKTKQPNFQLWACLRVWRFIALRKKRRFCKLTNREHLEIEFVEDDLPLHGVVTFINGSDPHARTRRFDWARHIVAMSPTAAELLDRRQRVALYYALAQTWDNHDHLSWFVAQSETMLLRKDIHGQCVITHALQQNCPHEIVMLMAVELARSALQSLDELLPDRQYESARRLCVRMVEQYFAGVPHFPHAYCLQLLRPNTSDSVLTTIERIQHVWREFADKWGHYGVPLIQDDLPHERHVPLDSFLQLSIKARGEPLSYQWFCGSEPLPGATQTSLFVSQCVQPHNQGLYYCEVSNWKGRTASSVMQLVVVDDRHGPDPSLRFLLSERDRESLLETDVVVHRIAASRGGLVQAKASMEGCAVLLPPKCFSSFDADGVDVSDSVGMEIVVRPVLANSEEIVALSRSERLVSLVIEVLPFSMPSLTQPALLSIPHCWSSGDRDDALHELVVIELPTDASSTRETKSFQDVDRSRVLEPTDHGVVTFEVSRFGRFAVLARSLSHKNKENEAPLEDVVVYVLHSSRISAAQQRNGDSKTDHSGISLSLWLVLNRPDCIDRIHQELHTKQEQSGDRRWMLSAMAVKLRANQLVHFRVGRKIAITHVWRGVNKPGGEEILQQRQVPHHQSFTGVVCLRDLFMLPLRELSLDLHLLHTTDGVTVFHVLELLVSVVKQSAYASVNKRNTASRDGINMDRLTRPDGQLLSEQNWQIVVPVIHDTPVVPAQPTLHQRRRNQLAVAYNTSPIGALFEELHEMEREFTPYFFRLEVARFSETFWQRYDRTWWFDKTKSTILLGMYKVAHSGVDPYAVVASDAFAGVIRVVQCSVDTMSAFSEPLLLEPPSTQELLDAHTADSATTTTETNDDDQENNAIPRALRRPLTLPPSLDRSPQNHASMERLKTLLSTTYADCSSATFTEWLGVELELFSVSSYLELHRDHVRAANYELALLVLAMDRLEKRICNRVYLRSKFFIHVWGRLWLLKRLIPQLDGFPTEYFGVTCELHAILKDLFRIVLDHSSPGWLARLLLEEWHEDALQTIVARVVRLLHTYAQSLQGSQELATALEVECTSTSSLDAEHHSVRQLREYLLQVMSQVVSSKGSIETQTLSREIAAMLQRVVPSVVVTCMPLDDWEELVAKELHYDATLRALQQLRERDTLTAHIRSISPFNQQRFSCSTSTAGFPKCITVCLGLHVVAVDTQHALKVTNTTLRCGVQGITTFSKEHKRLVFMPSIPFDKHTQYQIKLRAQYVHTALSGALLPSATVTFEFATVS